MHKQPLSVLLRESWRLCSSHATLILMGVLFFGSLSAGASLWMEGGSADIMQSVWAPLREGSAQMRELADAFESGTNEDALNVLVALQGNQMAGLDALSMLDTLMPVVKMLLWSAMISFLIACLSSLYFLCSMTLPAPSALAVIKQFLVSLPAMILIMLWSSARSFAWVPMVGPWISLFLFPRFLFAPIISIRERKNPFAAVQESYRHTKGSAWYVLSAFSVISFVALLAAAVVIVLLAFALDPLIGSYSVFLRSMIWQTVIGFSIAGLVVLWDAGEEG